MHPGCWHSGRFGRPAPLDTTVDLAPGFPYLTAMTKREILTIPDPILRQSAAPIERVDDELRRLMDDMLETMYEAPGIGLAAPQVGVSRRLIVMDVGEERAEDYERQTAGEVPPTTAAAAKSKKSAPPPSEARRPICMVNPEIIYLGSQFKVYEEGCLSLPEVRIDIERPSSLKVRYIDRRGHAQVLAAEGLLATVIQHEVDHLDGKLIIDFLSRLKRDMIVRRFRKAKKGEDIA